MTCYTSQQGFMRILIIDNNEGFNHLTYNHIMKQNNCECIVLNDALTGVSFILEEGFDIVILNADMPEFSDDVIEFIAINGKLNDQKIIMLKSLPLSNERVKELLEQGIHSCLGKSVSPQELLNIIKLSQNSADVSKQKIINTFFVN